MTQVTTPIPARNIAKNDTASSSGRIKESGFSMSGAVRSASPEACPCGTASPRTVLR